jgi:hypothetical protein
MTQYLISLDDGAMTFPEEEMPDVTKAAHEVVATDARVGCQDRRRLPLCARGTGAPARPGRLIEGDPPRREQRLALGAVCASTCTGTWGGDRLHYGRAPTHA